MAEIAFTTAGQTAAWNSDGDGFDFSIAHFRLYSGNSTPDENTVQGDLGTLRYPSSGYGTLSSHMITSQQYEFRIHLDSTVGSSTGFTFQSVALYLDDSANTLFAVIVLDDAFTKVGGDNGNVFNLNIPMRFDNLSDPLEIVNVTDAAPARIVEVADLESLGKAANAGSRTTASASYAYEFTLPSTLPDDGTVVATLSPRPISNITIRQGSATSVSSTSTALSRNSPNNNNKGLVIVGSQIRIESTSGETRYLFGSNAITAGRKIRITYDSTTVGTHNVYLVQDLNILAHIPVDTDDHDLWSFDGYHHIGDLAITALPTNGVTVSQSQSNDIDIGTWFSSDTDYASGDLLVQTKTDSSGSNLVIGLVKKISGIDTSGTNAVLTFANTGGPTHNMATGDTLALYVRNGIGGGNGGGSSDTDLSGYATESWVTSGFVNVTGDTMTGDLNLNTPGNSDDSTKAASTAWVRDHVDSRTASTSQAGISEYATNAEHTQNSPPSNRTATPAGVKAVVDNLVDGAPSDLNTLNELAAAIGDDAEYHTTVDNALAARVRIDGSDTMTGALNLVTPPSGDDSTKAASTAWVRDHVDGVVDDIDTEVPETQHRIEIDELTLDDRYMTPHDFGESSVYIRGWATSKGTDGVAFIHDSYNVSSLTDLGAGHYRFTWENVSDNANDVYAKLIITGVRPAFSGGHLIHYTPTDVVIHPEEHSSESLTVYTGVSILYPSSNPNSSTGSDVDFLSIAAIGSNHAVGITRYAILVDPIEVNIEEGEVWDGGTNNHAPLYVRLREQPSGTVSWNATSNNTSRVTISGGDGAPITNGRRLTFTTSNWDTWQELHITGGTGNTFSGNSTVITTSIRFELSTDSTTIRTVRVQLRPSS